MYTLRTFSRESQPSQKLNIRAEVSRIRELRPSFSRTERGESRREEERTKGGGGESRRVMFRDETPRGLIEERRMAKSRERARGLREKKGKDEKINLKKKKTREEFETRAVVGERNRDGSRAKR